MDYLCRGLMESPFGVGTWREDLGFVYMKATPCRLYGWSFTMDGLWPCAWHCVWFRTERRRQKMRDQAVVVSPRAFASSLVLYSELILEQRLDFELIPASKNFIREIHGCYDVKSNFQTGGIFYVFLVPTTSSAMLISPLSPAMASQSTISKCYRYACSIKVLQYSPIYLK